MLEPLLHIFAFVGLDLDVSSSKSLADSLDWAVGDDPYFNKLICILATRCMTQVVYFCSGDLSPPKFHHYGLVAPLYYFIHISPHQLEDMQGLVPGGDSKDTVWAPFLGTVRVQAVLVRNLGKPAELAGQYYLDGVMRYYSSLEVASEYFRSGADKISIGSDVVYVAEDYLKTGVGN
ncbi:unnamed protein product [Lactuca saligna]|uniref:Uncharacterized protein n=1 Tax=Lactuca saligna TaxID=75948 RepID=A0AA35YPX1_LACSI|nr:unnamed protein product [Lactuca saligna]